MMVWSVLETSRTDMFSDSASHPIADTSFTPAAAIQTKVAEAMFLRLAAAAHTRLAVATGVRLAAAAHTRLAIVTGVRLAVVVIRVRLAVSPTTSRGDLFGRVDFKILLMQSRHP